MMSVRAIALLALVVALSFWVQAQPGGPRPPAPPPGGPAFQPKTATGQPAQPPRAPRLGPRYRGGDGTPGTTPSGVVFDVLAPEATGVAVGATSTADPVVLWYLQGPEVVSITLKLNVPAENLTVGRATLPPAANGYRALRLSAVGLPPLRPGVVYRWFLEIQTRNGVSGVAGSSIVFRPFGAEGDPTARCSGDAVCGARASASAGYWYDAVARLSTDASPPKDEPSRALWKQLLNEVGLGHLP